MYLEGNVQVIDNVVEKQRRLTANDSRHEEFRTLLVVHGGGLRGVQAAGYGTALDHFGLRDAFDESYTASTGAPKEAYRLAGQLPEKRSVYWNECTTRKFIDMLRPLGGRPMMDIDYLCNSVFRGRTSPNMGLDIPALRKARTRFYAAVTSARTGEGRFMNVNDAPDPINVIRASIAVPLLSHGNVVIDGEPYLDGAVAYPFTAAEAIARSKPTDVLIFANRGYNEPIHFAEGGAVSLVPSTLAPGVRAAFATRARRYVDDLTQLRTRTDVRWAIVWGDPKLKSFSPDTNALERASRKAEMFMTSLLADRKMVVA